MSNIYFMEDHDEALKIWRRNNLKELDLVHLDAHIDLGFHPARPIDKIVNQARTLKELKTGLEHNLAFRRYEKDFDKQTHIGNYIYPAMEEGIVKDFYWVIPGDLKEFKKSSKFIKNILKSLSRGKNQQIAIKKTRGIISTEFLKRNFIVCVLETLPFLRQPLLLDIDIDFLVIDSLLRANSTINIGKRKPWILPQDLTAILKERIKNPQAITIAYSVNGGWTPLKYKHLGDEIAYYFAPEEFKGRLRRNLRSAEYFNLFTSTRKKKYYLKAVKINPTYRAADNNYGSLYLWLRKFSFAQNEFLKILKVDPENPACLFGLGTIALERKNYKRAKRCFSSALRSVNQRDKLFTKVKRQGLLGLAKAEFKLNNLKRAKKLLFGYQTLEPLHSESYYLLGRIFEKEKDFAHSIILYKHALQLGYYPIEIIRRILRIPSHLGEKKAAMKYALTQYNRFKKGRKINRRGKIEKDMVSVKKILSRKS